jgi:hypothetical protein
MVETPLCSPFYIMNNGSFWREGKIFILLHNFTIKGEFPATQVITKAPTLPCLLQNHLQ